jgi:hypothetical protein
MGQYVPRLPLSLLPLADRAYTASRINVPIPRVRAIAIPNADPWSGLEEAAVREEEEWAARADHREVAWEAEAEGGACRTSLPLRPRVAMAKSSANREEDGASVAMAQ